MSPFIFTRDGAEDFGAVSPSVTTQYYFPSTSLIAGLQLSVPEARASLRLVW